MARNLGSFLSAWHIPFRAATSIATLADAHSSENENIGLVFLSMQLQSSEIAAAVAIVGVSRCVVVGRQRASEVDCPELAVLLLSIKRRALRNRLDCLLLSRRATRAPVMTDGVSERSDFVEGIRVLVVDDHDVSRLAIKKWLRDMGFEVVLCADVDSAIKAFEGSSSPLALVDIQSPVGNGIELTQRMRAIDAARGHVVMWRR